MTSRRGVALVALAALLAGGALLDRRSPSPRVEIAAPASAPMPVAAPASALSSTWYCAAATAEPNGRANGTVVVANPSDQTVRGSVTFIASAPDVPPKTVPLEVAQWSRAGFTHADHVRSPWAAALVEVEAGGVVVEHSVTGPLGADVAPCASTASDRWYFADGGTTRDATLVYALFNPFPEDAIVDLAFATDQGRIVPQALQGVVVPARGLLPINVGDHVLRRRAVSATIRTRTGRIVADRVQTYDGTDRRRGLALVNGTPSLGREWWFPEGYVTDGMTERYQLYNPSPREARVSLALVLEQGEAEPFDIAIPPNSRFTLNLGDESRVPRNVGHAVIVLAESGDGIVVERSVDAGRPAPRSGLASTMGARLSATRWVFASGLATPTLDEWIVLQNPGTTDAKVSFIALASGQRLGIDGLQGVDLPAGRRRAIRVGDHIQRADLGLLLESTAPIVAERGLYRVRALGISIQPGIPLRD